MKGWDFSIFTPFLAERPLFSSPSLIRTTHGGGGGGGGRRCNSRARNAHGTAISRPIFQSKNDTPHPISSPPRRGVAAPVPPPPSNFFKTFERPRKKLSPVSGHKKRVNQMGINSPDSHSLNDGPLECNCPATKYAFLA